MKASIKKVAMDVTTKTGRIVNLIVLSNDTVIVRDTKQYNADLKGSHVKRANVLDLYNGTIEGDFKWHKKGQPYTTTEYVDKEGETVPAREGFYEEDGYRVEGFLTLSISNKADTINRAMAQNTELVRELLGLGFSSFADDDDETAKPKAEPKIVKLDPQIGASIE